MEGARFKGLVIRAFLEAVFKSVIRGLGVIRLKDGRFSPSRVAVHRL